MGKRYDEKQIIQFCKAYNDDWRKFYKQSFVNYRSNIIGSKNSCTEVVARFVLGKLDEFKGLPVIKRKDSYNALHDGVFRPESNCEEELDAIKIFNQSRAGETVGAIGTVIDYQIPLKSSLADPIGKIDLLSESSDSVYAIELKRNESRETLLRCILEAYTYSRSVDKKKLFADFGIGAGKTLKTAILIYENSAPYKEYLGLRNGERPGLKMLFEALEIWPFLLRRAKNMYHTHNL